MTENPVAELPSSIEGTDSRQPRRRQSNRKPKQGSDENAPAANETKQAGESHNSEKGGARRRTRQPRAPRVHAEDDARTELHDNEFVDGVLKLKVASGKPRTIYTRLVRLLLAGLNSAGDPLETKEPIRTVEVSALGGAIQSAIFVTDNLVKGKVLETESVTTDFVSLDEKPSDPSEGVKQQGGTARIQYRLKLVASWKPAEDEVLLKTRVYRQKVLGLTEEAKNGA